MFQRQKKDANMRRIFDAGLQIASKIRRKNCEFMKNKKYILRQKKTMQRDISVKKTTHALRRRALRRLFGNFFDAKILTQDQHFRRNSMFFDAISPFFQ